MRKKDQQSDRQRKPSKAENHRDLVVCLYDNHATMLYRYALMLLTDSSAADDALHQVFVKLLKMDHTALAEICHEGYLRKTIRNECYRILGDRRNRKIDLKTVEPFLACVNSSAVADEEEKAALENALRRLPSDQREVIHLKIYEDMTFQQIADSLDESINTIASRYRYAMDKLKKILNTGEEYKDE